MWAVQLLWIPDDLLVSQRRYFADPAPKLLALCVVLADLKLAG
jgi:hypothetical protein